jgi:hypothetical protein
MITHSKYNIFTVKVDVKKQTINCDYLFEIDKEYTDHCTGTLHGVQHNVRLYQTIGFELLSPLDKINASVLCGGVIDYTTMDYYQINHYAFHSFKAFEIDAVPFFTNWHWLSVAFKQEVFNLT